MEAKASNLWGNFSDWFKLSAGTQEEVVEDEEQEEDSTSFLERLRPRFMWRSQYLESG